MRFLKKTAVILAALLTLNVQAFAQVESVSEINRDYVTNVITVKGEAGENEKLSVRVIKSDADLAAAAPESFAVLDELTAAGDGGFSYSFYIAPDKSGDYKVIISAKNSENKTMSFYYGITADVNKTTDTIKQASDWEELAKILKNSEAEESEPQMNHTGNLMLDNEVFSAVSKDNIAKRLISVISPDMTSDDLRERIMTLALLECYNEGKKDMVSEKNGNLKYDGFSKLSSLDGEKKISAYSEYFNLTEAGRTAVISMLMNNGYQSFDELYRDFAAAVVINSMSMYSKKGYEHVTAVLENNAAFAGIDISEYEKQTDKNAINSYLVLNGSNIHDRQTLKNTLADAIASVSGGGSSSASSPSSSSSSSAGGGGGGSYNQYQTFPEAIKNEVNTVAFADVAEGHWAYDAIVYVGKKGIINGSNGNFRPDDYIKREEFVKIIAEAFDLNAQTAPVSFSDVAEDAWYAEYINAAVSAGVVNGVGDSRFGIGEQITRQDVAVILQRVLAAKNKALEKKNDVSFDDADEIGGYAKEAVEVMAGAGVVNGVGENKFAPRGLCTRAQAAQIICNVMKTLGM